MTISARTSDAREAILKSVRASRPDPIALPDVARALVGRAAVGEDPVHRFAAASRAAGATTVHTTRVAAQSLLSELYGDAQRVVSATAAVRGTMAMPVDPHELAFTDLFVCEGVFGVIENGAIWLPQSRLGQRAALFLATNVLVLLDASAIVEDLHAAYARLDLAVESFGVFVAGPSKTADIEQSLVVGAHGPKALTVALLAP